MNMVKILMLALLSILLGTPASAKPVRLFTAKAEKGRTILSVIIRQNGSWEIVESDRGRIIVSGGGGNAVKPQTSSRVVERGLGPSGPEGPQVPYYMFPTPLQDTSDLVQQLARRVSELEKRDALRVEKDRLEAEMQMSLVLDSSKVYRIREIEQILKNVPECTIQPRKLFSDVIRPSMLAPERESSGAASAGSSIARNYHEQLQQMLADNQKSEPLTPKK